MKPGRIAVAALTCLVLTASAPWRVRAQSPPIAIREADLQQFLTYIASDQLLGREAFTEGFGLAAGYVAAHLEQWGVKPLGDNGTYLQTVKLHDVKIASDRSTVTVEVNGRSRTFANGEGVRFVPPLGGKQTVSFTGAEFVGYGLNLPDHDDYAGRNVRGQPVIWVNGTPAGIPADLRRLVGNRDRHAIAEAFAAASVSYSLPLEGTGRATAGPSAGPVSADGRQAGPAAGAAGQGGRQGRGRMLVTTVLATPMQGDFRTTEDLNRLNPPEISGADEFFELLFTDAPTPFSKIKALAANHEPLPTFTLPNVKLTFAVDADYEILHTLYTHNVIGMVEGADSRLRQSYVMLGAHLDHIGYLAAPRGPGPGRATRCPNATPDDVVNNGADDDGSGTVTELAIARAFATGPKPKRSLIFVWHSGEELGLYGSRYGADFPVVPLDRVDALLNMDMIGRDDQDDRAADNRNSVFVVGADRISSELHNAIVDANATMARPLTLDYAMNDPTDPEAVYYRSDHYSYAAKGIPIAFFTTGLHDDYHCVSDTADKIRYEKMARIGELVYRTAFAVASRDTFLARDNRGPRTGRGFTGKLGN